MIEDQETGFVTRPLDPADLADAMQKLARDPSLRRSMGTHGRRRAVAHFSVEENVRRTVDLYKSVWESEGAERDL